MKTCLFVSTFLLHSILPFIVNAQKQNELSIEQFCLNIFQDSLVGSNYIFQKTKYSFDGITESRKTWLYNDYQSRFPENLELKNYENYNDTLYREPISLKLDKNLIKSITIFNTHPKLYIYQANKVGLYYYVTINLASKYSGYIICFQFESYDMTPKYFVESYVI